MADLSVTPASVLAASDAIKENGVAGATITAGQVVSLDSSTGTYKLSDADSATAYLRSPRGIALHGASNGQPLQILRSGTITIGATTAIGTTYFLSPTAGGICPDADVLTGDYATFLGIGTSTTQMKVNITESGAARA